MHFHLYEVVFTIFRQHSQPDLIAALESLSFSQLDEYISKTLATTQFEFYAQGNVDKENADLYFKQV